MIKLIFSTLLIVFTCPNLWTQEPTPIPSEKSLKGIALDKINRYEDLLHGMTRLEKTSNIYDEYLEYEGAFIDLFMDEDCVIEIQSLSGKIKSLTPKSYCMSLYKSITDPNIEIKIAFNKNWKREMRIEKIDEDTYEVTGNIYQYYFLKKIDHSAYSDFTLKKATVNISYRGGFWIGRIRRIDAISTK